MPTEKQPTSAPFSGAASDSDIIRIALELATAVRVRVEEAQIPSSRSMRDESGEEWPKEEEAFWAVRAPAGKNPVTVIVESNGSVRGVVPGDGVTLQDSNGVAHATGVVIQMSVREDKVRVLVERVRPIESTS